MNSKAKLDKSIEDGIAMMMSKMAGNNLKEYDSSQLSKSQRAIVETDDKNVIVVAGAGSGKTRVLTERIKYLVESKGVDPSNIVAITFTNMAADEMRERLAKVKGIGDAFIGTIHAFANKIFANSGSEYQIFNDEKDNEFHKYLIENYCTDLTMTKYLKYKDMKVLVDQGRASESDLQELLLPSELYELKAIEGRADDGVDKHELMIEFPETVLTLMKKYNVISFNQLLEEATRYFNSLNSKIEYVLVDEFQDVGPLEYNFIKGLNAENSMYVGDDWQSIYSFKGSSVRIFKSLVRGKEFKTYYLAENYRSAKKIIEFANSIINQVDDKINKEVKIISDKEGSVVVDSKFRVNDYLKKIKSDGNYKDWFILTRNNKEIFEMCDRLSMLGIPYSSFKKSNMTLNEMRLEMSNNTVKVLTVHTSKGLESKNVLLVGNFPVRQPPYLKNPEERRVMYVGCTRSEENLIVLN